jgi:peptidoglycan hydrolase CwlO-like protein
LKNGGAPLERELEAVKKQVKELVSKARSNGDERNDFASRELELHHKEVASMQETVTALKSELRAKVSKLW